MVLLGIILMLLGGFIFMVGEHGSCLLLLLGGAINVTGLVLVITECLDSISII
jgi:hypothetical protein